MCDYGTLHSLREHEQQSKDAQFLQCTTRICGQTLLRTNVPSVNVGYISRSPGTSPVACEFDEQWTAVRTAFNRLCSMYVVAMSAQSERDAE